MIKKFFIILFFLWGWLFFSHPVFATTIISPLLELEVEPGQTQRGIVKVFNETAENLYLISSVEAFKAGDENGQPVYLPKSQKTSFVDWFNLEQDSIVLKPRQVAIIPFSVTVPVKATPGGYYAVIFWQTTPGPLGEKTAVGVSSKTGTLIFLKVKGEIQQKGEILEFTTLPKADYFFRLPIIFSARFLNSGNIHLQPIGTIKLKNWLGQTEILAVNQAKRYVLPDSVRRFEVVWGESGVNQGWWQKFSAGLKQEWKHLIWGKCLATLDLAYGSDNPQTISKQFSFWFIPLYSLIVLGIIVILLLIFAVINSKIKKLKKQIFQSSSSQTKEKKDV